MGTAKRLSAPGSRWLSLAGQDREAECREVAVAAEHLADARGARGDGARGVGEGQFHVGVLLEDPPGFGFGALIDPRDPEPGRLHGRQQHGVAGQRGLEAEPVAQPGSGLIDHVVVRDEKAPPAGEVLIAPHGPAVELIVAAEQRDPAAGVDEDGRHRPPAAARAAWLP